MPRMTPAYCGKPVVNHPVVMMSPVLLPYVQAPVRYLKSGILREDPQTRVRYIACYYVHQPQCVFVGGRYTPVTNCTSQKYAGTSRSVRSSSNVTPPFVSTIFTHPLPQTLHLSKSNLNPLSRPYTPLKSTPKEVPVAAHDRSVETRDSGSSVPDLRNDDWFSEVISRSNTPATSMSCNFCQNIGGNESDFDSGVDSDSEYGRCSHYSKDVTTVSGEYPDLRIPQNNHNRLPRTLTKLVEFICEGVLSHEWRAVARDLGVSDVIIRSVDYDEYDDFHAQMRYVFTYWASSEMTSLREWDEILSSVEWALREIGREDLLNKLSSNIT